MQRFIWLTFFHLVYVQVNENDVYFSFLPLAHIFDRVAEEMFVFTGSSIGFWQGVWLEPVINSTSSFISKV
jgi:long-subunit acyl-CoA synthetase (AMP-forming)